MNVLVLNRGYVYKLGVKRILNFRYSNILQINERINELFFKNFLYN